MSRPVSSAPKITATAVGINVFITDGTCTRQSSCANRSSAKGLATRLTNNPALADKWLNTPQPIQLALPLEEGGPVSGAQDPVHSPVGRVP